MLIMPALDLKDGKCVQLVGGVSDSEQITINNVLKVAEDFYNAGPDRLHIIDLDAAKNLGDNLELIKKLLKNKKAKIQVGGGIRNLEKARYMLNLGADYIIVGTAAIKNISFLENLNKEFGKEKIIVSLDYKHKKVLTDGWDKSLEYSPLELAIKLKDYCSAILLTCVDNEGKMVGPDLEYLDMLVKKLGCPIIASGGISRIEDLKKLKALGIFGAVIGMALYKGKIELKEAMEL